jgi:hypothetical protein
MLRSCSRWWQTLLHVDVVVASSRKIVDGVMVAAEIKEVMAVKKDIFTHANKTRFLVEPMKQ